MGLYVQSESLNKIFKMKRFFLIKLVFILIVFQIFYPLSFCQKQTIFEDKIIFISIIEFNNLVWAYPNDNDNCNKGYILTEKTNLSYLEKFYPQDKDLFLFYPNCYQLKNDPKGIRKYIIPYVNDTIKQLLLKDYKKDFYRPLPTNEVVSLENFKYNEVTHSKYMLFLVNLEHFNKMNDIFTAKQCDIFVNEKTYKGLYIKTLVPIYE